LGGIQFESWPLQRTTEKNYSETEMVHTFLQAQGLCWHISMNHIRRGGCVKLHVLVMDQFQSDTKHHIKKLNIHSTNGSPQTPIILCLYGVM